MRLRSCAPLALLLVGVQCTGVPANMPTATSPGTVSVPVNDSPAGAVLALADVNVVTMSGSTVSERQTIIVRNGRIESIGLANSTAIPSGAFVIPGGARLYVLPGLADMHVHLFDRDEMVLYLANGVTTVRNMHGLERHLAWRDSIDRGELRGPRLFTAGPIIDGDPPARSTNVVARTADDARRAVNDQISAGYDFVKIYDNLPPALFRVVLDEAHRRGRKVVGHIPTPVGLAGILGNGGQDGVEHAEELLPFFDDGRSVSNLAETAQRFAASGVWLDATIGVYASALSQATSLASVFARPEMAFVNPETMKTWGWEEAGRARNGSNDARQRYQRTTEFFRHSLIPEFRRAKVRLLSGSDAPIPALLPGFALLDELDLLADAGLTPYEVLQTTTTNAAEFLGKTAELGVLRAGRLADLLIVDGNPLESLSALRARRGVVVAGRWMSQVGLQARLDSLASVYRQR